MPNDSEGPIIVFDNSVVAINLALAQVLERLDMGRGLRGAAQIFDRTAVGGPIQQDEAVRLGDIPSEEPSSPLFWLLNGMIQPPDVGQIQREAEAQFWPLMLLAIQMLRPRDPGRDLIDPPSNGTYTPTLTNVTNLAASTAYVCHYLRIGTEVVVSGKVDVDPTAAGSCKLGLSLPFASNLAAEEDCCGAACARGIAGLSAAMLADTTNDRAQMEWIAVDTSNQGMFFTFGYRIL